MVLECNNKLKLKRGFVRMQQLVNGRLHLVRNMPPGRYSLVNNYNSGSDSQFFQRILVCR